MLDVTLKSWAIKLRELKIRVCHIWFCSFTFVSVGPGGLFLCSVTGRIVWTGQGNTPRIVARSPGTSAKEWDPGLMPHLSCRAHSEQSQSNFSVTHWLWGLRLQHQRWISLGWTQGIGETGISLSLPRFVHSKQVAVAEALPVPPPHTHFSTTMCLQFYKCTTFTWRSFICCLLRSIL